MASTFLTRTAGSAVTAERKKYTISVWVKRSTVGVEHAVCSAGNGGGSEEFTIRFDNTDKLNCFHYDGSNMVGQLITNRLFRDVNAWYHIYFVYDSANSTQADRFMLYINGERETSFSTNTGLTQNDLSPWNVDERHQIGSNSWANSGNGSSPFDGVMSHFYNVAGSHIAVTQFGSTDSTTGEWKINTSPTISSYGTDGFLVLKDGNTATDQSPNSNNFTITGTLTKSEDNPSNVFCTWNPLNSYYGGGTFSWGNNKIVLPNKNGAWNTGTLGMTSGKYYWEIKVGGDANGGEVQVGIADKSPVGNQSSTAGKAFGYSSNGEYGIYAWNGAFIGNAVPNSYTAYGATSCEDGYIMIAVDLDNNKFYGGLNGTWFASGNPSTGTNGKTIQAVADTVDGVYYPAVSTYQGYSGTVETNFGNGYFADNAVSNAGTNASGNGIFKYDVPTGYTALSTKGLNL